MFQLILPFQLELQFEAEAAPSTRSAGGPAALPRTARTRRAKREPSRTNLAFEFSGALQEE